MFRIIPIGLAASFVGLAGCAMESAPESVSTKGQDLTSGTPYLALGDSVAFGYNPVNAVSAPTDLNDFVGYPELIGDLGKLSPGPIANAACQGETSGSFISTSNPDNGCHAWRVAGDAMHVTYTSTSESQLQFALAYLAANPKTTTVSLGIGADDLLVIRDACEVSVAESGVSPSSPAFATDVANCELPQVPAAIEAAIGNIGYIVTAIRESGYAGQLVLVTYYALQYSNTSDPTYEAGVGLDEGIVELAQAYPQLGLSIAKGFSAFAVVANAIGGGDSCKAGLLYSLGDGTCDEHPSTAGQAVLAAAVAAAVPASKIDLAASPPQF